MQLDLTRADTGRIIDYWLGGSHNFEVDRTAADRVAGMTPSAPAWARAQRDFLQKAVRYMSEVAGIDCFLVAGAGLPTCGNVHEVAPSARVIYTDINPVTIAYGQNIIGSNPRVRYVHANATKLHEIDPKLLDEVFGKERRLGIIFIGVAYFFAEDVLRKTIDSLWSWAAEGSHLAVSFIGRDSERYASPSLRAYAQMGNPIYPRDPEEALAALGPWQPTSDGLVPAKNWREPNAPVADEPVYFHVCVCEKPVTSRVSSSGRGQEQDHQLARLR